MKESLTALTEGTEEDIEIINISVLKCNLAMISKGRKKAKGGVAKNLIEIRVEHRLGGQ